MKINKRLLLKSSRILLSVSIILLITGIVLKLGTASNSDYSTNGVSVENGVQTISLKAGLGYTPNRFLASSQLPTKLEIQTNNTYDCTAFLNIPKLNIKKFLPPTGITEIELQSRAPGDEIEGFCGSDTYKFVIKFS